VFDDINNLLNQGELHLAKTKIFNELNFLIKHKYSYKSKQVLEYYAEYFNFSFIFCQLAIVSIIDGNEEELKKVTDIILKDPSFVSQNNSSFEKIIFFINENQYRDFYSLNLKKIIKVILSSNIDQKKIPMVAETILNNTNWNFFLFILTCMKNEMYIMSFVSYLKSKKNFSFIDYAHKFKVIVPYFTNRTKYIVKHSILENMKVENEKFKNIFHLNLKNKEKKLDQEEGSITLDTSRCVQSIIGQIKYDVNEENVFLYLELTKSLGLLDFSNWLNNKFGSNDKINLETELQIIEKRNKGIYVKD